MLLMFVRHSMTPTIDLISLQISQVAQWWHFKKVINSFDSTFIKKIQKDKTIYVECMLSTYILIYQFITFLKCQHCATCDICKEIRSSQSCIKKSPLGQRKKWSFKTGDLLKQVQFMWNCLCQDKKNVTI
jgi:hypothetical protein